MRTDSTGNDSLPPYLAAMTRLFEDDVTPENVEQHIEDYLEKSRQWLTPEELHATRYIREVFLKQVRKFAAYEVGGRGHGATAL